MSESGLMFDNKDSNKSRQILEAQLNKVNEYNLKKIQENEKKKEAAKKSIK